MVTDGRKESETRNHVDAGDRHEPLQTGIVDGPHGKTAVKRFKILADPLDLPKAPLDCFSV